MGLNQGIKSTQKSQTIFVNWFYALDLNTHLTPRSWAFGGISTTSQQPIWPTYQIPSSLQSSVFRDLVVEHCFFPVSGFSKICLGEHLQPEQVYQPKSTCSGQCFKHRSTLCESTDRHSVRAHASAFKVHQLLGSISMHPQTQSLQWAVLEFQRVGIAV